MQAPYCKDQKLQTLFVGSSMPSLIDANHIILGSSVDGEEIGRGHGQFGGGICHSPTGGGNAGADGNYSLIASFHSSFGTSHSLVCNNSHVGDSNSLHASNHG